MRMLFPGFGFKVSSPARFELRSVHLALVETPILESQSEGAGYLFSYLKGLSVLHHRSA